LVKKQDALVSGTNIKTVNGQSLLGNGDLEVLDVDLSDYYTKAEIDNTIGDASAILESIINGSDAAVNTVLESIINI
jgi:hypothetical protein